LAANSADSKWLARLAFSRHFTRHDATADGAAFTIAALARLNRFSPRGRRWDAETHHDPNQELNRPGYRETFFARSSGAIAATGAIARTAANIRNGGAHPRSPGRAFARALGPWRDRCASGCLYSSAALSAILLTVAVRMAEHTPS